MTGVALLFVAAPPARPDVWAARLVGWCRASVTTMDPDPRVEAKRLGGPA